VGFRESWPNARLFRDDVVTLDPPETVQVCFLTCPRWSKRWALATAQMAAVFPAHYAGYLNRPEKSHSRAKHRFPQQRCSAIRRNRLRSASEARWPVIPSHVRRFQLPFPCRGQDPGGDFDRLFAQGAASGSKALLRRPAPLTSKSRRIARWLKRRIVAQIITDEGAVHGQSAEGRCGRHHSWMRNAGAFKNPGSTRAVKLFIEHFWGSGAIPTPGTPKRIQRGALRRSICERPFANGTAIPRWKTGPGAESRLPSDRRMRSIPASVCSTTTPLI